MEGNGNDRWLIATNALVAAGLPFPQALALTSKIRDIYPRLQNNRLPTRVAAVVADTLSPATAQRYRFWHQVYAERLPILIHIMGVTGVGKTDIASALSKRLVYSHYVQTDMLRDILRAFFPESRSPALHVPSYRAWEVTSPRHNDRGTVVRGYLRQCRTLDRALSAISSWTAKTGKVVIIEGIDIGPDYIADLRRSDVPNAFSFLVAAENEALHWRYLEHRWRTHPKPPVPIEVYRRYYSEIRYIQDFLIGEADKLGIPILANSDVERVVREILTHIEHRINADV